MMKKILLFGAIISILASCGEDDPKPTGNTGPATPQEKYNALLMMGSDVQNPASAAYEASRLQALHEYPDDINTIHMVVGPNGILYDPYADTIMMNFQSPMAPYFVLDDTEIFLTELITEAKSAIRKKPLLAVTNKVSQNDTAWIIDHKVKFFMDTTTSEIYIDTYMLGASKAREYSTQIPSVTFDLRMAATQKLISNPPAPLPLESQWDYSVYSIDSSKVLAPKGSSFYYKNMLMAKYDSTSSWGYPLGEYWPFGGQFYKNDIIGTNDTRIRHYFRKFSSANTSSPDFTANTELRFMSIVWIRDPMTGSFVHANSYISSATFRAK